MITLAIDGSTKATGWAVFDDLQLVDYGVFRQDINNEKDFRQRIIYMAMCVKMVIEKYKPSFIYMEQVPPTIKNSSTVLVLGVLQGAILIIANELNVPIQFIPVSTWHSALSFYNGTLEGKTKKFMKQNSVNFVNKKYGLQLVYKGEGSKYTQDDIADAICIGTYALGNYEKKEGKRGIGKSKK